MGADGPGRGAEASAGLKHRDTKQGRIDPHQSDLLAQVRACNQCANLPLGPRPILQYSPQARILIAGQAPGRITHAKRRPFDDPSGERLRQWLGVSHKQFYDHGLFAIMPVGFCFPGSGKSGDLAPRSECAPLWRAPLLAGLGALQLTIIIGRYARDWHLPDDSGPITPTVQRWRKLLPAAVVLPHPSPRNNLWLKRNPWFDAELLPDLKQRVAQILT